MAVIRTVTGAVEPSAAGVTLMHEHLMFGYTGWHWDTTFTLDREQALAEVVAELRALKAAGGATVVDVTPICSGRDVDFLVRAAKESGVQIVACTGFWSQLGMPTHFQRKTVDELEDIFVRELSQGMAATAVPAGIIKVGTMGEHMTEPEHRLFQAAARASVRTGATVTTHVSSHLPSPVGVIPAREQLKVLLDEERMNPSRVVIGHCDAVHVPEYHLEVVQRGVYAAFDHICDEQGAFYSLPDDRRIRWVLELLEAGYERQLLFSTDRIAIRLAAPQRQRHTLADLVTRFLPKLKKAGVGEKTLHTIMVENPQRALAMP